MTLLLGIAVALGGGGALGWWLRKLGEVARRRATEVYYEERLKVCERARNRARIEADELEQRARVHEEVAATAEPGAAADQLARDRAAQVAELMGEVERLQSKLRERDAAHARLRSELDARNADRAQQTNGRGELSRIRTELAQAKETLQQRETSLSTLQAELDKRSVEPPPAANGRALRHKAHVEPTPPGGEQAPAARKGPRAATSRVSRNGRSEAKPAAEASNGNGHHGPSWLMIAADGDRDDLKTIRGLGPVLERGLNELGIFQYRQLARMTPEDAVWLAPRLKVFPGRLIRDDWAKQAREMHLRKYKVQP